MTSRIFKWSMLVSSTYVVLFAAASALLPPPSGAPWQQALVLAVGIMAPVALWSPVGLACATGVTSGWARVVARAGIVLTLAAMPLTVVALFSTGLYLPPVLLPLVPLTAPVAVLAVVCAYVTLLSRARVGPRLGRLVRGGIVTMLLFGVIVIGMMIADTGNRTLFGLVGALLLMSFAQMVVVTVGHWRQRRRTVSAQPA